MSDALKDYLNLTNYLIRLIRAIERDSDFAALKELQEHQKCAEQGLKRLYNCAWYKLDPEDWNKSHGR